MKKHHKPLNSCMHVKPLPRLQRLWASQATIISPYHERNEQVSQVEQALQ